MKIKCIHCDHINIFENEEDEIEVLPGSDWIIYIPTHICEVCGSEI